MPTDSAVTRLQELVRVPTISRQDEAAVDWAQFDLFIATIARLYPLVHSRLQREIVAGHSLLFRWPGRAAADPTVLMGHYDVVAASDEGWRHPPFDAVVEDSGDDAVIWGRGTVDDKGAVAAILEAVEGHLEDNRIPSRDIYLSFGHDEETAGSGAAAIVDLLESRGIRPALVLDEGGAIVEGVFPGVAAPVGVVGVSEKGVTTLRLVVEQFGGHASTPPRLSATARLARAIVRLNARPFRASLSPTALELFRTLAGHTTGAYRFAFGNLWLTKPFLLRALVRLSDETSAMTRTTQAVTMLEAGQAVNALAERATATVNVRVAVGSTAAAALAHVRRAIHDEEVRIEVVHAGEPATVSPTSGLGWDILRATIEKTHPGTIVAPYVQNGATDSRHFTRISRAVYRFTPFELSKKERDSLHATNERMHVATYLRGIEFYRALVGAL